MRHWRECLSRYLEARQQDRDADRAHNRAEKNWLRLSGRMDDSRAYKIADVDFADQRSLKASRRRHDAERALYGSLRSEGAMIRLYVLGLIWCESIPKAQNDNGRREACSMFSYGRPGNFGLLLGKCATGPARWYPAANS